MEVCFVGELTLFSSTILNINSLRSMIFKIVMTQLKVCTHSIFSSLSKYPLHPFEKVSRYRSHVNDGNFRIVKRRKSIPNVYRLHWILCSKRLTFRQHKLYHHNYIYTNDTGNRRLIPMLASFIGNKKN